METKETVLYHLQHLRQLVFEVTDSCNLNCSYCGVSHLYEGFDNRNGKYLLFKKARVIIDYLFSIRDNSPGTNYPLTISFYGGEPLVNTKFIRQVIEYLNNPQWNHQQGTGGDIIQNLHELTFYFNTTETGNDSYHKQFLFPKKTGAEINPDNIISFIRNGRNPFLANINLVGNIFIYHEYSKLMNELVSLRIRCTIYITYDDFIRYRKNFIQENWPENFNFNIIINHVPKGTLESLTKLNRVC